MDVNALKESFESNPTDAEAVEQLHAAYLEASDQDGLRSLYSTLGEALSADDGDAAARDGLLRMLDLKARTTKDKPLQAFLYGQLGVLHWKGLDNPDKAELYFRRSDTTDPDFAELHREFYTLFYARRGNWRRLEGFLLEGEDADNPEVVVGIKRRLAKLALDAGSPEKAVSFWAAVLDADPADDEAEGALVELYAQVKKWHSLIDLYNKRLDRLPADETDEKIALYMKMITIYKEQIRSETKVNATYQAILEIDPSNEMALGALESQFESMKRWPDLVRVLQQRIAHTNDKDALIALHQRIADIMLNRFSNSGEALKSYHAILDLAPDDRDAITQLKDLYEKRRNYEKFLEVARLEVNLEEGEDARRAKLLELARFAAQHIRKPAAAIELWEEVLALDPEHLEALESLEALYERGKDYEKLADALERRIGLIEEPKQQVALLEKLGLVLTSRLKDTERAADVYRRVLAVDPKHRKAQNELRKHYLERKDWDGLEWFFREYGSLSDLVRTLDAQAKNLTDPEERISLLFKSSELALGDLEQPDRAVRILEKVLAIDGDNAEAARRLTPLYRQGKSWEQLAQALDVQLRAEEDMEARQSILLELAKLYEERLDDVDQAFFSFVQVFKEDYESESQRQELERLAERSENWDTYAAVLEETLPRIEDKDLRSITELRTAEIYRDHIGDKTQALRHFQMSIAMNPQNRPAIDAIEDLYADMGEWRLLVELYKRKRELAHDEGEEKEILFRLGAVWRDQLNDNDEAAEVLRELSARFPDDARVHRELSALYLAQEDWESLLDVMSRELTVVESNLASRPSAVAALHCQIAQLTYALEGDLHDVVHHYRAALSTAPNSEMAVRGLEELISAQEVQRDITEILEPVYQQRERWDRLADVYEIQLKDETPGGHRIAVLRVLGELYRDRIGDDAKAFRTYARVLEQDPAELESRKSIEALAAKLEAWQPLVELYEEHVDDLGDPVLAQSVRLTIARTYDQKLEDAESAQLHFEAVLESEPNHPETLDALERIYGSTAQWKPLLEVYRSKLENAESDEARITLLSKMEQVWSSQLDNVDEAIDTANEILVIDADSVYAYRRLEELQARADRHEDLAHTLEQRIRLAGDNADRLELMTRLADTLEFKLEDVMRSIDIRATALGLDADHGDSIAALERLFADKNEIPLVAPLLEAFYQRKERWAELISVIEARKEEADDPNEQVDLDFRIAGLYEDQVSDGDMAFLYYGSAFSTMPDSKRAQENLLRLGDMMGSQGEAIALLDKHVEDIGDPDHRRETHRTLAGLAESKTEDLDLAKRHYAAVLELAPDDLSALDALLALHRRTTTWESVVELLQRKAELTTDAPARTALMKEAAALSASELEKYKDAIEIYETAFGVDPNDFEILTALEMLYEHTGDAESLVGVLERQIERTTDLGEKKAIARRRAGVYENQLEAPEDAIYALRQVLEWDAEDADTLRSLGGLFNKTEDWTSAIDNLKALQPLTEESEQNDIQFQIGQLHENAIGDVYQAIGAYQNLLEREPTDERALSALEAIVLDKDERKQAFEVLSPALELLEQWQRLYDVHEVAVEHAESDTDSAQLLRRMADLAENQLSDADKAFECNSRAFRAQPDDTEIALELERLGAAGERMEPLQALYQSVAEEVADPMQSLRFRLRAGEILKDSLGDSDRAVTLYEALREDQPDSPAVLRALDELYTARGDGEKLADVLRSQADLSTEPSEKTAFAFRLGEVLDSTLGRSEEAYESYRDILFQEPGNDEAIKRLRGLAERGVQRLEIAETLEPIYRERESWSDVHQLMELRLEITKDPVDRGDLMRNLAQLNVDQLDRPEEAIGWYGQALALDPDDEYTLGQIAELAELTDAYQRYSDVVLAAAENAETTDRKIELWNRAVGITRDKLDDKDQAELLLLRILDEDEENQPALASLDDLYVAGERWEELEGVLTRRVETAEYDDDQRKLLQRLAELYRDRLGNYEDAVVAYRKILDIDESNENALRALTELYEVGEDWEALSEVKRSLATLVTDESERIELLHQLARLAEDKLDNRDEAMELWEESLLVDPTHREAVGELARLQRAESKWDSLAETLQRQLDLTPADEAEQALAVHLELGRLWRDTLEDPLRSQSHWEKVREADADNDEALTSLRSIYRDSGAIEPLAGVLEKMVDLGGGDTAEQLEQWTELAQLRQDALGAPDLAVDAWESVLILDTKNEPGLDSLERLYTEAERWGDAVRILHLKHELLEEREEHEDATDLSLRIAHLEVERLEDRAAAAKTLEAVMERQPNHLDASTQLEGIYEADENWSSLGELLLSRIEHLDDPTDKGFALHKLAKLYEDKLGETEAAFLFHQRALADNPEDMHSLSELDRLAKETGSWAEYAESVLSATEGMDDPFQKAEALHRLGVVVRDELDKPEDAIGHFQATVELQPEHEPSLEALVELHTLLEQWESLIEVLTTLTDIAADYRERVRAAVRIGSVFETQIGDTDKAVEAYKRVLELDEQEDQALQALERLHEQREEWTDLVEVLDLRSRLHPDQEVEFKLRAASIFYGKLNDSEQAIEVYESILERDPANDAALTELQGLYGASDDWEGLIAVYERLLLSTDNDSERKALHEKVALVQEEMFQEPLTAADSYREILAIDPMDRGALANMERIFEATESWDDLVSTYERHVEVLDSQSEQIDVLKSMAATYHAKMNDLDGAIRTFERILDLDAANDHALDRLETLYGENGEWERVLEILDRKMDHASGEGRTALRCEKAAIYAERLLNIDEATAELDRAMDEAPSSLVPVQALQRVYAASDNWEKVVDALLREEELHEAPELKAATLVRVAEIYRDNLVDTESAVDSLERALSAVPGYAEAALPLSELYIQSERWAKADPLLRLMVEQVESEADPTRASELYYLIGRSKQNLLEVDEALDFYRRSIDVRPDHVPTLRGLAELNHRKQRFQDAETYYLRLVEQIRDSASDEELVVAYRALGDIALSMNEDERAYKYLDDALQIQPNNLEAIQGLIELARDQGNWSSVVRYQRQLVDLKSDALEKLALQLEVGDIYKDRLDDVEEARAAYRDALEVQPNSKAALLKLLDLAANDADHEETLDILKQLIEAETDPAGKSNFAYMLALVYRDEMKDEDQALVYLDQSLDHDPLKLEAFATQDEILTRRKAWEDERRAYLRQIERIQGKNQGGLEYKLYRALGEIYRTRLKNYEYAISAFELAAQRKPNDTAVFEILAELYDLASDDKSRAVAAHRNLVRLEPAERVNSYRALYRLWRGMGRADAAWCVAGLLTALNKCDEDTTQFFDDYREASMAQVRKSLDGKQWAHGLLADPEDLMIGEVFQIIFETIGNDIRLRQLKDLDLRKKDQISLDDGSMFANTLKSAAKTLGVTQPRVFLSERVLGMRIENLGPPAIIMGKDMLKGRSEKQLAFLLGKVLTYFLPSHILAAYCSTADLKTLFLASMKVCVPGFPVREDASLLSLAESLDEGLPAAQRQRLAERLKTLSERSVNLNAWQNNVELTAIHAGALLANDFPVTWQSMRESVFSLSKITPSEKLKDIVVYIVSERYMKLRKELGLSLADEAAAAVATATPA